MAKLGVLIIHGMGSQRSGFSKAMDDELRDRLGADQAHVASEEIFWADDLKQREDDLWSDMKGATEPDGTPIPLDWETIRRFVVHNFGDAIAYQRDAHPGRVSAYTLIHKTVSEAIKALKRDLDTPTSPIVVLAHSLGAHIMSSYVWDRQHGTGPSPSTFEPIDNLLGIVSFGCNIPLFGLSFDVAKPINLPGADVTDPALVGHARWKNFIDRDDVLGWPLKPLYERHRGRLNQRQRATVDRIEDYEINVGWFATSWNPASHIEYWTDDDLTRPTAIYLRGIVQAL